ncbi:MAG: endo-1,4-beta-xylanase [Planctomycetota bacterium]
MKSTRAILTLVVMLFFLHDPSSGYEIPSGGTGMLAGPFPEVTRLGNAGDPEAEKNVVEVKDMHFQKAVRVRSTRRPDNQWGVVVHADTRGNIAKGDVILISFWMRTVTSESESGQGTAAAMLERNRAPHENIASRKVSVGDEWQHCVIPGRAQQRRADGEHQIAIHLGFAPQCIEIGDFQVINYERAVDLEDLPYMRSTYEGREPDAAWRKAAKDRIRKHRQGELVVRVRGESGDPVSGARVSVTMRRHQFDFGCVLNPSAFARQDKDGRKYRQLFERYFTKAPTESGFRWQNWSRGSEQQRMERRQRLDAALNWLNERDIEVRGHYLMWAPIQARNKPVELVDQPEKLLAALWRHAEKKAKWAGKRVQEWDAINHIVAEFGGTRFDEVCGGNSVYADMIKKGREWVPHAEMWVNEGQILVGDGDRIEAYQEVIEDLTTLGAKPDGIGFMGHFQAEKLPHPEQVFARVESFDKFGCQMQLTEFDVECGPDEQLQADYLRDIMTIAFSHPSIEAIVMWGFWEGRHWRPSAALWRKDWSLKPAGEAWLDLVRDTWWTDVEGVTNKDGVFRTRGFLGEYQVTVSHDGRVAKQELSHAQPESISNVTLSR